MTLTVCLKGLDGIVLASDSRGTFGDPRGVTAQNDTLQKVYLVRNIGILMAGSTQGNMIIDEVSRIVEAEDITDVTLVMEKVRETSRRRFNEWFPAFPLMPVPGQNSQFVRPGIQLSIAGYCTENEETEPRIYSMVSNLDFAPTLHDFGFALGGVVQYALYLLNRLYSSDMEIEDLKHLAAYVVTETAEQDGKVGGPVQIGIIQPEQQSLMLNREDIDTIIRANVLKSTELKGLFRTR